MMMMMMLKITAGVHFFCLVATHASIVRKIKIREHTSTVIYLWAKLTRMSLGVAMVQFPPLHASEPPWCRPWIRYCRLDNVYVYQMTLNPLLRNVTVQ